jgi:hypothetical protein
MKTPSMDKLYYFTMNTGKRLAVKVDSLNNMSVQLKKALETTDGVDTGLSDLNELFGTNGDEDQGMVFEDVMHEYSRKKKKKKSNKDCEDSDSEDEDEDKKNESIVNEEEEEEDDEEFGDEILRLWKKREEKLTHDYAIAAWMLSPVEEIRRQVKEMRDYEKHDVAVERLLVKLFLPENLSEEEKENQFDDMTMKFWNEYEHFAGRTRCFARRMIWSDTDITNNLSHMWHKKFSLPHTKYLGKLACKVTSKITGIGNAERCWGAVKNIKDGQRSHISPVKAGKQAAIMARCKAKKARIIKEVKSESTGEVINLTWNDEDMDALGLDRWGIDTAETAPTIDTAERAPTNSAERRRVVKKVNLAFEKWEKEKVKKNDPEVEAKFLNKYRGLNLLEGSVKYRIHPQCLCYDEGWNVVACTDDYIYEHDLLDDDDEAKEENDDKWLKIPINKDLPGLIWSWYHKNPDEYYEFDVPEACKDADGGWNFFQRSSPKKRKRTSGSK